jgi:hypothetical protein
MVLLDKMKMAAGQKKADPTNIVSQVGIVSVFSVVVFFVS